MFVACVLTKKDMQYYLKIDTCFKRVQDKDNPLFNCIIPNEFTRDEFAVLQDCRWLATEKVDGTNMSYHFRYEANPTGNEPPLVDILEIHGKTPDSKIPIPLIEKMQSLVSKEDFHRLFLREDKPNSLVDVWIFGEGYGKKIQKFGNDYISNGVNFIVFDIKIGNIWLTRGSVEEICQELRLDIVPIIDYMTLNQGIRLVEKGFKSRVAENENLNAEGLVLSAPCMMLDRLGNRIVTKIKTCDFNQLKAKLKSNGTVLG